MITTALAVLFATASVHAAEPTVVTPSDVVWEDLNPARGDQSPRAGTLWGDRKGSSATGFLLAPTDGFESPPHIHNVSYRGVVLRGVLHNDDPGAAQAWLPAGSFWTQPAGEAHITAARGSDVLAYIEIDSGPYLVQPVDAAYDNGERPLQLHTSNLVWVAAPTRGLQLAYLWGQPQGPGASGAFLRVPGGGTATVRAPDGALRAVVVSGRLAPVAEGSEALTLGSFLSMDGGEALELACQAGEDCTVYLRAEGPLDFLGD